MCKVSGGDDAKAIGIEESQVILSKFRISKPIVSWISTKSERAGAVHQERDHYLSTIMDRPKLGR